MNNEQKEYLLQIMLNNGYSEANFYTIYDIFSDVINEIRQEGYDEWYKKWLEDLNKYLNNV